MKYFIETEYEITMKILFTDEVIFEINPSINKQNCRFWASTWSAESVLTINNYQKIDAVNRFFYSYFFNEIVNLT